MVRDKVEDDSKTSMMSLFKKPIEVLQCSEDGIDFAIVRDVVAEICHRRGEYRRDPNRIDPQPDKVVEAARHSAEIPNAVAVAVLERSRVDLIDHAVLPPVKVLHLN